MSVDLIKGSDILPILALSSIEKLLTSFIADLIEKLLTSFMADPKRVNGGRQLKVSYFRENFLFFSILPKHERKHSATVG